MTKTLDENDLDEKERTWHDTLRPTWGPNGTLVFATTPQETLFGRSGRITEKNGLMTVLKGAIVSESQDIRIAKFSNEVCCERREYHFRVKKGGADQMHTDVRQGDSCP